MAKKKKLSPMMQQYTEIKKDYEDCILFFRLGDFYEMFFDDAITASRELELTLTGKNCGLEERAPMCGVPFHSAETYISKLIEKGYKVAICEQTENPETAKGIVKREVIQIVTPGTILSSSMLKENENNYIASIFTDGNVIGLSYCDISTGEISLTSISDERRRETLINELVRINAKEVILDENTWTITDIDEIMPITGAYFNMIKDEYYRADAVRDAIKRQFGVSALFGIGIQEDSPEETAIGSLLLYLFNMQKNTLDHITMLNRYNIGSSMALDKSTIKNLELTETLFEKKIQGSLLGVLDKTHTAMGSRKLRQWIKDPLNDTVRINLRLDAVDDLCTEIIMRNNIREHLKRVYDFERLIGRIAAGNANGKDLIALKNSCAVMPDIKQELLSVDSVLLTRLNNSIHNLNDVYLLIDGSIMDDPPFSVKEGEIIKYGYSSELDDLKNSIKDAQEWITGLEVSERKRTGIKNLKVGFNKVFGYYIEVTKSYYNMIPDNYVRKQTLANCERFITPELKETERLVLNAESKINQMEYELFVEIRKKISTYIREIQETSAAIAGLDVLVSFADVSDKNNYVKPEVDDGDSIIIEKGRHPVIEQTIKDGIFVGNDIYIDRNEQSLLLITGPNMAGKSTYMRQTALIVLMAQAGCFVPCSYAKIGVCDRIFTRIGASDNLAQGQSTFFVEMSELSYILNTATEKSLVILDEIGRGTSTYDGLSIAWATAEFLCSPKKHIRTLFATHYHEMTALEETVKGIKNFNVDVAEENGDVVFLHKIVQGSASRSYGIYVAKLAGAPPELLRKAEEHLIALERENRSNSEALEICENTIEKDEIQLSMFEPLPDSVLIRLKTLDLMNTTPSEALGVLEEIKKYL